jgi:hypothetical protein
MQGGGIPARVLRLFGATQERPVATAQGLN